MKCTVKKSGNGAVIYIHKKFIGLEVEVILPTEGKLLTEQQIEKLIEAKIEQAKTAY